MQQITQWGPSQRARYESFSSVCGLPGSALAGQILGRFGNLAGMRIAAASSIVWMILTGSARTGQRFYWAAPAGIFMMISYTAMAAMLMVEGTAAGMAQGELQGAIGAQIHQETMRRAHTVAVARSQLYASSTRGFLQGASRPWSVLSRRVFGKWSMSRE